MKEGYHLDHEMTKQELQMENRFLRKAISDLAEDFIELDLELGRNKQVHDMWEQMLVRINAVFKRASKNQHVLIKRFREKNAKRSRVSRKDF